MCRARRKTEVRPTGSDMLQALHIGEIHPRGEVAGCAGTQAGTDGPLQRPQALRLHSGRAAGYRAEERTMIARNGL